MTATTPHRSALLCTLLLTAVLLVAGHASQAHQFRIIRPILTPDQPVANLPSGAVPVREVEPLTRAEVEPMVRKVIDQWNTSGMADTLSDQFYDANRLLDVVDTAVPRDAKLRVQSIQGVQTLQQYLMPGEGSARGDRVSVVSATVRTQLEFNAGAEFKRLQGTNEFILEVIQAAPP